MKHHPEAKSGEKFMGNHHGATLPPHLAHIDGIRLGAVAYYLDGPAIPAAAGYRPLLANRHGVDMYNLVMSARFSAICRGAKC